MIISVIAAIAKNRAIGYQNKLIYHIKEDMKRFQKLTTGHPIIMGRKTFESLPHGPLPDRRNIIVSSTLDVVAGAEVAKSLDDALQFLKNETGEVFIIGGASLYEESVSKGIVDKFYMTEVDDEPAEADRFFPEIPMNYDVKFASVHTTASGLMYSFVDYERC